MTPPSLWTLEAADATCGGKAAGLARLRAAGLAVPDGFVIGRGVFQQIAAIEDVGPDAVGHALAAAAQRIAEAALPPALEAEVAARAAALGRLAVRSSASLEDGADGAAPGVLASVTDVAPGEVWAAVRAVWTSALTPLAVAYARHRGAALALAVIVQRFVPGERRTVYTRPPGAPAGDEVWIARGDELVRVSRAEATRRTDGAIALAAEAAIGAPGGADVELVVGEDRTWVVQARPIVHPERRRAPPPPPIVLAALVADGRRWTWDVAHNPDPLSPAQAGLVEAVEAARASPYAMRVCGGYLYTAARDERPSPPAPLDRPALEARVAAICARFELPDDEPSVADAVARYVAFVRVWAGELSPLVAVARRRLLDRLAAEGCPASERDARAAALIGPRRAPRDPIMAPAWDVAVPTFAERPTAAVSTRAPRLDDGAVERALEAEVELARAAADAAELDDLWFARAQWMVRRALLARGQALGLRGDDVFWLPLTELVADRAFTPDHAHRLASAARAAHARASAWRMPLVVDGTAGSFDEDAAHDEPGSDGLRGVGVGPRVVGRVVRFASLAEPPSVQPGEVVVARAITPALAMIVEGCAALVSETGGLLDHGASLARELGVTCVVGCKDAWSALHDGALVAVDGDAGIVRVLAAVAGQPTRTTTAS